MNRSKVAKVKVHRVRPVKQMTAAQLRENAIATLNKNVTVVRAFNPNRVSDNLKYLTSCSEILPDGRLKRLTMSEIARRIGIHRNRLHYYRANKHRCPLRVTIDINVWAASLKEMTANQEVNGGVTRVRAV